jgi:phosphoglycerol transferase MdoB-like AlkP superfamily enzyme
LAKRWHQISLAALLLLVLYVVLFTAVAEVLFWDEFGARFNFIAVDYLIYTKEVVGNIRESYSLPLICGTLGLVALLLFAGAVRSPKARRFMTHATLIDHTFRGRVRVMVPFFVGPLLFTVFLNGRHVPEFRNLYEQELARNGSYSLFAAFRNNELNFEQFYDKLPNDQAFARARKLLASDNSSFVSTNTFDLTRYVRHTGQEQNWNVIQITVESLSAEFLGAFGNTNHLTPNLDALAGDSLNFTNFYASGTRTVRGMEALTLSLPPTPGQSIVRRPHNENMFTLGSVLRDRGYDTSFIYGGYGYFDNMNAFFSGNGYRVIDRSAVSSSQITFANAWGACDENVFDWSLDEADRAFTRQQPFFQFVMTTSNHRPYTYPAGRIDIPSGSGREGGVKYTDYAIGQFIEKARSKPWFKNTLFVIVADHCAASAGRNDLPVKRYQIPLLIYNPDLVSGRGIGTLCSQIDYAPTLLGLLNWSYKSRFFGKDILRMKPEDERAYISTYQKLGLLEADRMVVLMPVRRHKQHTVNRDTGEQNDASESTDFTDDCIASYQTASYVFKHRLQGAIPSLY